jgi:PAS domain S-box-containing protein
MKLLLIEDDASTRALLERLLAAEGYAVSACDRAERGWELFQQEPLDLLLMDWVLPGMQGAELCRRVRAHARGAAAYVVVVSGDQPLEGPDRFLDAGADDFLAKPIQAELLRVRLAIARRRIGERRERQRIVRELQSADQRNAQIHNALSSIIFLIGVDGESRIVSVNKLAEVLLGISASHFVGRRFQSSDIFWDAARIDRAVAECRETRRVVRLGEIQYTRADDREGYLNLTVSPIGAAEGGLGVLLLGEEVTDHKVLQMRMQQAKRLDSIGKLAAGIAHEINTPIQYVGDNLRFVQSVIGGLVEPLRRFHSGTDGAAGASPEARAEAARRLAEIDLAFVEREIPAALSESLEGVARVAAIVGAMKDFSHPGAKEKVLIDLNRAIQSTVTIAQSEWKHVAETELEFDPQLGQVECLAGEFNQVILNLVVNAAHAIGAALQKRPGAKGRITIRTRRVDDSAVVEVQDTGTGIAPEHRERLFEPFFTTKEVGKGTGQGLALAYTTIVEKHQGSIDVDTAVGKGTTFTVRIPLRSAQAPARGSPAAPPGGALVAGAAPA